MSEAIHDVLHNGDPTYGWQGDHRLTMTHSSVHGWELWLYVGPTANDYELIAKQRIPNQPLNLTELVRSLAMRDTRNRGVSHESTIEDYLDRVETDAKRREREMIEKLLEPTARVMDTAARAAGLKQKDFW